MSIGTDSVSTCVEDDFTSTATFATSPSIHQASEERHAGQQSNPFKSRLEPTGHPPTYQASMTKFAGTLEELIEVCATAEPGTILDLGGESIRGGTEDLSGVARSLSSVDIDNELSDSDSTETWQPEVLTLAAATAVRSAVLNTPAGKKRRQNGPDISMLLQQSPPFLLAETPPVESGPLEPTYSFASIPKEAFSGSLSSTEELPDPTRLGSCGAGSFSSDSPTDCLSTCPIYSISSRHVNSAKRHHAGSLPDPTPTDSPESATPTGSTKGSTRGASRLLRQIASDAGMRMRINAETTGGSGSLLSGECVRRSCEFDSRGLDERLAPGGLVPPVSCIVLTGNNVTIRNGSIILPHGCLMLLERGVMTLQGCHIIGTGVRCGSGRSLPLVYVLEASVTMRECRVCRSDGHGIGVGSAASLVMERCNVSDHATCGIVVRGSTSSIELEDCCLESNGQDGVAVSDGALARANNCMLSRNGMLGLGVSAAGKAFLTGCIVERNGTHGLAAHAAASLNASSCSISGCEAAILALDAATVVHATACVLFKNEQGLHIRDGAQVYAVDTSIERHTIGALVTSTRTYLECSQTVIKHSRRAGMHVLGGARANLLASTVASNGDMGCFTQHAHSKVLARDSMFTGNGTSGALVSVGASMHLFDCELTENRIAGAQSTDGDTTMMLRGCILKKNGTIGLFANKGSTVNAAACRLTHNGSSGCEVRDRCTRLLASNCDLSENGRVGLYVHSAGTLSMAACTVAKNRSLAVLCGGREGTDIGGGLVTHCPDTVLSGGTKMRHGGRMYKSCEIEDDSEGEAEAAADAAAAAAALHANGMRSPAPLVRKSAAKAAAKAAKAEDDAGDDVSSTSEGSVGSSDDADAPGVLADAFSALLEDSAAAVATGAGSSGGSAAAAAASAAAASTPSTTVSAAAGSALPE